MCIKHAIANQVDAFCGAYSRALNNTNAVTQAQGNGRQLTESLEICDLWLTRANTVISALSKPENEE